MTAQNIPQKDMVQVLGLGGRLGKSPAQELIDTAFAEELEAQKGLFAGLDLADLAYVIGLIESRIVPEKDGADLLAALLELRDIGSGFEFDPALGDIYTNREAWLSRVTPAAGWLGTGRARRESTTTAFQIVLCQGLLDLANSLCSLARALAERAATEAATQMPDYTYLQAGQPTSFGHYLLSFAFPILRDLERLKALYSRVNKNPSGCGSANGSTLVKNRARLTELLGFDGLVDHARDAMWQADIPIETLSGVVSALVNMDRLAEDLMLFSTVEFGLVTLSDAHARASKIMPQKNNPFALAYIRGLSNQAIGVQATLAASGRTPSGQVDNRMVAYGATPKMIGLCDGAARLMAAVVRDLSFDRLRARAMCRENFCMATDLAECVMRETQMDYRSAHHIVGRLARNLAKTGKIASDITGEDLDQAARDTTGKPLAIARDVLTSALDPTRALANRDGPGGAAPSQIKTMIASIHLAVNDISGWLATELKSKADAETKLLQCAAAIAGNR